MTSVAVEPVWSGAQAPPSDHSRLPVLDGWRGISIISVLACHLLPIGPKWMGLNAAAGLFGMSLFFTLSGFLITATLYRSPQVLPFLIRRLCRILPLAYLYITVSLLLLGKGGTFWLAHCFFTINYQTQYITELTGHFWSLCVEIQFYVGVAIMVLLAGRRGLLLLPVLCIGITLIRVWTGTHASIVTHLRIDEILAGATLALIMCGALPPFRRGTLARVPWFAWLAGLLVSCHEIGGPANYLRPYLAAGLVGSTIWGRTGINACLETKLLKYIAGTSYAIYVFHPLASWAWLGTGGTVVKYVVKRPITFALTFLASHLSTCHYERRWIELGRMWANKAQGNRVPT